MREHLDHLEALDVTHLHLMPLLQPRPGNSDGGYAVMDYRAVREDLGSMEDLRGLASDLHERGLSLELDLVLNHVAREHEWARRARAGEERYREYFLTFPDRTEPDRWEESLPEVFPDFAPGNFTWDEEMGRWVWTTFHDFQWDLNWANPDVFVEFADIVLHLANQGADVLRLDAIAFIWKRLGTTSQNLPEVHFLTRALRAVARIAAPALALKAEAIVGPQDLIGYLGRGENAGKLSDTAYHNSLMVQLWSALAARDTRLLRVALEKLPAKPASTTWSTYIRCHDDIGWAVTDEDAADAGLHGPSHRAFLSDFYAGEFPGSFAEGLVFQHDPATGDKRISGSLASLAGLERALAAHDGTGDARAIELAVRRILLLHAAMLGFGGVPLLYMGDELALLNDHAWAGEPGHEDDNRWVHRPRMDWDEAARVLDAVAERTAARGDTDAAEESPGCAPAWAVALSSAEEPAVRVLAGTRHLARVRSALPQLHAAVESRVLEAGDDRLLLWLREHPEGAMVQVMNVSESAVELDPAALRAHLGARPREAITQARWNLEVGSLQVQPYQTLWFLGGA